MDHNVLQRLSHYPADAVATPCFNNPVASNSLAQFSLGKLPLELRNLIWGKVEVKPTFIHSKKDRKLPHIHRYQRVNTSESYGIPAVLHACQDSRKEWFARPGITVNHPVYTLVRQFVSETPENSGFINYFFADFENDIVMINPKHILATQDDDLFHHLGIKGPNLPFIDDWSFIPRHLGRFRNLSTLTLFSPLLATLLPQWKDGEIDKNGRDVGDKNFFLIGPRQSISRELRFLRAYRRGDWTVPDVIFKNIEWLWELVGEEFQGDLRLNFQRYVDGVRGTWSLMPRITPFSEQQHIDDDEEVDTTLGADYYDN